MEPKADARPIFIVSSPRSGSTLLRLILDAHPRLAIPPPGHLFHLIFPYLYSYGNLKEAVNLRTLVEDVLETPTIKRWPIKVSVEQILAGVREPSFAAVYEYLHVAYAESQGKVRWGEKTPRNGFWMDEIKELFPRVQFIHLLRDGRDAAIDIADADFWPHSIYGGAQRWKECVRVVRNSAERLDSGTFIEIRYEELCREPERILRQLCDFLGEEFVPALLHHHETRSTQSWSQDPIHGKIAAPITTDYVDMYKTRLPARDRAAIEALIGDTLREAGYPVEGKPEPLPYRAAAQLIEGDMVSMIEKVTYKAWHRLRRRERRERGVWRDSDQDSFLWGFD